MALSSLLSGDDGFSLDFLRLVMTALTLRHVYDASPVCRAMKAAASEARASWRLLTYKGSEKLDAPQTQNMPTRYLKKLSCGAHAFKLESGHELFIPIQCQPPSTTSDCESMFIADHRGGVVHRVDQRVSFQGREPWPFDVRAALLSTTLPASQKTSVRVPPDPGVSWKYHTDSYASVARWRRSEHR